MTPLLFTDGKDGLPLVMPGLEGTWGSTKKKEKIKNDWNIIFDWRTYC